MQLITLLQNFGLNEKQAELYLALLQLGTADIQTVVDTTNFKRTTAYSVLEILIEKGLVHLEDKDSNRIYYAENPKKLTHLLAEENKRLLDRQKTLIEAIPELTSLYNAKLSKPRIHLYEDISGIKKIYEEMLMIKSGSEILSFESATLMKGVLLDIWMQDYTTKRLAKNISHRAIVEDSKFAKELQSNDKKENRQTLILPKDKFPLTNEINIFGNKIAIINFKELVGVIIESADVTNTNKSIFELAWLGAKHIKL